MRPCFWKPESKAKGTNQLDECFPAPHKLDRMALSLRPTGSQEILYPEKRERELMFTVMYHVSEMTVLTILDMGIIIIPISQNLGSTQCGLHPL